MKTAETLKLNKDFKRLYYRGKSVATRNVVIYAGKNRMGHNRIGLTCGKTVGKATKRNRAKRLMRESYRLLSGELKSGYDIVIVARTRIVDKKCGDVFKDVKYAFSKLNMII